MTKRRRKTADDGRALLRQRLKDLAHGALGGDNPPDFDGEGFAGMAVELGLEVFGRWLGGIQTAMLNDGTKYLVEPRNIQHFDDFDKATVFLWENGVRP